MNTAIATRAMHLSIDDTANFIAGVKAVVPGASTDQARPILTNVLVRVHDESIQMITTNSYVLYVITLGPLHDMPTDFDIEFMVNAKQLLAALPKGRNQIVSLEFDDDELRIVSTSNGTTSVLRHGEGAFPNWEQLINNESEHDAIEVALNPKYVADIAKAADTFRAKTDFPLRFRTGSSPMKPVFFEMSVIDRGTFFALLMPVRIP